MVKEILPLFDYLKTSAQTEQPLILTGFDMQLQSPHSWSLAERSETRQTTSTNRKTIVRVLYRADLQSYRAKKQEMIQTYKNILKSLQSKENQTYLQQEYPNHPELSKLLERSLEDRIRMAQEYIEISIRSMIELEEGKMDAFLDSLVWRDKAMNDNLIWLATEVYPNEKFIVWGHNDHIRKANSKVMDSSYPVPLMERSSPGIERNQLCSGLYASSGQTADNAGEVHNVD